MKVTVDQQVLRDAVDLVGESLQLTEQFQKTASDAAIGAGHTYEVLTRNGHCRDTDKAVAMSKLASVLELQRLVTSLSTELSRRPTLGVTVPKQASDSRVSASDQAFHDVLNGAR